MILGEHKIFKRKALARAMAYSGIFSAMKAVVPRSLAVFNYHRIAANQNTRTDFDDTMFGADEETFRTHLKWLKLFADPISEQDLIDSEERGLRLPKRSFLITFDDGYRDNFDRALPILREMNVPAIFFVPTRTIEERLLSWWDAIYWLLKKTEKRSITVRGQTVAITRPLTPVAELFIRQFKSAVDSETSTLLEELSSVCEVALPTSDVCDSQIMTWEQLREADRLGIAIGSHTHTHRVLSCLDLGAQNEELRLSKQILEQRLGKPVRSIAYPVGGYEHFNLETPALAHKNGYKLAFSFLTGMNYTSPKRLFDPFNIKRLDSQQDWAIYGGIFLMPWIFASRSCAIPAPLRNRQDQRGPLT